MSARALTRRVAGLARRQVAAAEKHSATAAIVDAGHAERVAFLMMVPEDLRMAVGIALSYGDDDALHSWALWPFARWAAPPAVGGGPSATLFVTCGRVEPVITVCDESSMVTLGVDRGAKTVCVCLCEKSCEQAGLRRQDLRRACNALRARRALPAMCCVLAI